VDTAFIDRLDKLSPYARQLLLSPAELVQSPIRAELFGAKRFEDHGRSLATAQPVKPFMGKTAQHDTGPTFFPRVEENIAALRQAYDYIAVTSRRGHYVTPAAQWLLDNFHLIEAQLQQIEEGVSQRYYADLPKLANHPLEGLPRVYGIAWAYVAHTDSVLDPELFTAFLHAYQDVSELTLGELWALPTTLRVVLLENLRRMADRIAWNKVAREIAQAVWDSADRLTASDLDELLTTLKQRGLERSFLTQLWQSLPSADGTPSPTPQATALARWTEHHCPDALNLIGESQIAQVAANLTVGNIITTLRLVGQVEWSELIEPVSHSLQVLRRLPSFSHESELTRQQITRAMERLARTSGQTEQAVARAVLQLAERAGPEPASRTAGYYLLESGEGRAQLEASVSQPLSGSTGSTSPPAKSQRRLPNRLALYAAAWLAGTATLLVSAVHPLTGLPWISWVALALMVWPASEVVAALMYRLIAESTRIQPLPRLDFSAGIPTEHATLVVMPTMLTSVASNTELINRLELHWLASRETCAQFALLTDWADADQAQAPTDQALLDDALGQLAVLNQRYATLGDGKPPRFVLLHRPRSWSPTEGRWIGWERKRGKLELLIRLLAQGPTSPAADAFLPVGAANLLQAGTRYIVTLDSDTGLPPGALRDLVSIAAHPLNTPLITPAGNGTGARVTAGYGILQPRVVTPLPQPGERSPFHALFAGQCGLDPYSSGASDLYQDLFGQGTFTGKGLLHVAAMHAVLDDRLPHDAVLSHDLLEGSIARCGYVGDVALLEEHPHHAGVAASRIHRWTRGDWQLLPLMRHARRYGIDALGLWRMADNLRRSMVAPVSLLLLLWVVFTAALPLGTTLAMVLATFLTGPLLGALAGLIPTRRGIAWSHFFNIGLRDVGRGVAQALWQFSQLLTQARLSLDAITRALWRMAVSRRQLLQWTTAAQAQAAARYTLPTFIRQHRSTSAAALLLAVAALFSPHPWAGAGLFLLWALAPLSAWWVSLPATPDKVLTKPQQDYLHTLARQTWSFFEACVGEEDHFLPPDNVQMEPERMVAHRTSPTNIGLYLLAVACARQFGWISTAQLLARLQATLASIDQLAKHDGHLFNWYDTQTLQVLAPAYVSTVDSGNLAGHLLTTAQACCKLADAADTTQAEAASLNAVAQHCTALCMAMNFSGLYSAKRHLFHIGLRADNQALDSSYYDLLASESRLTSFLAIAKGDVPRRHWQALGRPFLSVGVMPGLKSWSGSMFEYLMPSLVMTEPAQGLLHLSSLAGVHEQQAYGQSQQLPWGISESAYFAQDHTLAYQYGPFGVPRLALRNTPPTDRVVAPYASVMATQFTPHEAIANLHALEKLGARGEHGFMDAVDFTVSRQPAAERPLSDGQAPHQVVANFMAHHQGMSLVALCNVLCDNAPRRWFAASPLVQAYEALLHENTPRQIIDAADPRVLIEPPDGALEPVYQSRQVLPASGLWQPTQLLSNGRYSVALRANGAGVSRWNPGGQMRQVSRWRDDALRDAYGTFLYLRRSGDPQLSSVTLHPAPHPDWRYHTTFLADRVEFESTSPELHTKTTVLVSPEDDTELRTLRIQNHSAHDMTLDVISYFEPVLADARADEAHPAFSNLFIATRWCPEWRALVLSRKPRLQGEPAMAVAHFLADSNANVRSIDYIADRRSFLGRNHGPANPAVTPVPQGSDPARVEHPHNPNNQLDPACGLRLRIRIPAGGKARLTFATAAAETVDELEVRIDKYLQPMHVKRSARMAATLAQVRLRDLGVAPEENAALQDLTTALMYACSRPPQPTALTADRSLVNQRLLWRFGLSGDKPIVLVRIHESSGLLLVQSLLRAQPWWRFGGQVMDLVILNSEVNAYLMPLHRDILALLERTHQQTANSFPASDAAGFFLLRDHEVTGDEKAALTALARVVLVADGRPLDAQLDAQLHAPLAGRQPTLAPDAAPWPPAADAPRLKPPPAPVGRFDAPSGEFQFDMAAGQTTPRPWVNVIANADFGFQVSEAGAGYTWAVNSRLHQLTPWSNDPVGDARGEHYLLQDVDTGALLALTPNTPHVTQSPPSAGQHNPRYRVRHGQGYSVFEAALGSLQVHTTFFADASDPVKVVQLDLHHTGVTPRRLRAIGMAEWQMGAARHDRRTVRTWPASDAQSPIVFAQQRERRAGFGGNTAFFTLLAPGATQPQWTCDRSEFFNPAGDWRTPARLAQRSGLALDPCAGVAAEITLQPGEKLTLAFVLGHAADAGQAEGLAHKWARADTQQALAAVQADWRSRLDQVTVSTPDPLFNALVNHWLLYQTLTSRLWSKAGFYQAGGAFGFRDQLQDAMAFAVVEPARLRAQIVLNASRQFPEGDVQHWWHAPGGEGVRTHFSDDLLWLPYASAHYVQVTGDTSLLDQAVPFIDGAPIPEGAEDAYYPPDISAVTASVYEHCARTLDHSLRTGAHGLPLMGTGDWNDGMNRVGHEGRGESVWLAWFLCRVVTDFAPVAEARGDTARAATWRSAREHWITALHSHGWDGDWFKRAFFDNGAALGSAANDECRIDLIAQAWSVLSGASTSDFTAPAMASMKRELIDADAGLLHLLAPPFEKSANNPGYIQAYPPGVRENGGQYSHAGVWALMAQAETGDAEAAWESFQALSPAHRSAHPARGLVYELEPYVMAGDVYGSPPYVGRGGWSWYTGSAAWLYRAALESLLGLRIQQGQLSLKPCVPAHWPSFDITLRLASQAGRVVTVRWQRADTPLSDARTADAVVSPGDAITLADLPPQALVLVQAG
jgi:cyclic beta-1,2-glucan synthetase